MKKKILCLVATLVMMAGVSMTAHAEDFKSTENYSVNFDGKKMNSNFTSGQMTTEIYGIQPGDTMEMKVTITNGSLKVTDWYMSSQILASFEDNSKANGGAYTYVLTYYNPSGQEAVLYDSETVGGEGNSRVEGLHQATEALKDYFYLDRLETGKSGVVTLVVKLEGETQGNTYQNTLAQLQMNFAVEEVGTTGNIIKNPKTGDVTNALLFSIIALISGIILLIFGIKCMKKRNDSEEGE